MMARWLVAVATAAAVVAGGAQAFAHDTFRVIGTLAKHDKAEIHVKNADGKTTAIRVDKQTEVTRDKKKVDVTELKAGQSVVVDAYGDSEADLLALEIRIVPPIKR
jgi:hypothetical protein